MFRNPSVAQRSKRYRPVFAVSIIAGAALMSAAASSQAAVVKFRHFVADAAQIKHYCWRLHEPFWRKHNRYGCGSQVHCSAGSCKRRITIYIPPPPPRQPPVLKSVDTGPRIAGGGGGNGGNGGGGGGAGGSGGAGGAGVK